MGYSAILLERILVVFLLMMTGFAVVKLGLVDSSASYILNKIAVYVFVPCTIVNSFQTDFSEERFRDMLCLFVVALVLSMLFILVARLLARPMRLNGVERVSVIFSNTGSLVYPLIAALFGESYITLGTAYSLVQNAAIWSYGQCVLLKDASGQNQKTSWKVFLNPSLVAVGISLILFFGKITLPALVRDTISTFASAMTPITMMAIGMVMGGVQIRRLFNHPKALLIGVVRLLICPMLAVLFLAVFRVGNLLSDRSLLLIPMLAASAPSAVTVVNILQFYALDSEYAVSINVISDILCLATMPLMILISQTLLV